MWGINFLSHNFTCLKTAVWAYVIPLSTGCLWLRWAQAVQQSAWGQTVWWRGSRSSSRLDRLPHSTDGNYRTNTDTHTPFIISVRYSTVSTIVWLHKYGHDDGSPFHKRRHRKRTLALYRSQRSLATGKYLQMSVLHEVQNGWQTCPLCFSTQWLTAFRLCVSIGGGFKVLITSTDVQDLIIFFHEANRSKWSQRVWFNKQHSCSIANILIFSVVNFVGYK